MKIAHEPLKKPVFIEHTITLQVIISPHSKLKQQQ
jgi:hypothetical protein